MKLIYAIKTMNNAHGGAERVLADVTAGLARKGYDVSLLTFDQQGGESFYPLHQKVRRIDLGIGATGKRSGLFDTLKRMRDIRRVVRQEKPDAVVAFMHSMFIPMAIALMFTGVPVIASEHIVPDHYKDRKLEFALFAFSSLFIKRITVISEKIRETYPPYMRGRMRVVPNPVARPLSSYQKAKEQNDTDRPIILNVGRLEAQKDQETLIKAFAMLADDYPQWDLKIIGEGGLRKTLEQLVASLGLEKRVSLPGLSRKIGTEYTTASLFAMPSRYEAFGLATVEAMTYGLPVVGFADCPGTNEVIRDGHNGILVKGEDRFEAFAQGLKTLMDSESLRAQYGANSIESHRQFAIDHVIGNWEELISEVKAA